MRQATYNYPLKIGIVKKCTQNIRNYNKIVINGDVERAMKSQHRLIYFQIQALQHPSKVLFMTCHER